MSSLKNIWPIVSVTVAGHFVAAFAALCMPPFYGRLLQESFSGQQLALTGWFFTLPTLAAALANPCWGRLADRIGKRAALLRAHLGLALSFWLTSLARTPYEFALGLVAQGVLGGTFAASNAFLSTLLPARLLAQLLSVMQASARCALFLGPLAIGLAAGYLPLLDAFAYLAWLPLAAALFLFILPPPAMTPVADPASASNAVAPAACGTTAGQLYGLQFCFAAGTVLSFPYLVLDLGERFAASPGTAGLVFGLPHAIFLLLALPLSRRTDFANARRVLLVGSALTCAGLLAQAAAANLASMLAGRLAMGLGMAAAYVAINALAAATTQRSSAGKHYGRLEGANKWGAVAAGIVASLAVPRFGLTAPLWLGAAVLLLQILWVTWRFNDARFPAPQN